MITVTNIVYLIASVLFIFGLKDLSSPKTARRGNLLAMVGMLLAVVIPSLGMTMFVIVAGLVSLQINSSTFFVFAFFLLLIELVFITIFKSIRPNVNI